ncbi:MAG: YihY/virulence factor BrkB family protein, partial [Limisphaerales bacterium]
QVVQTIFTAIENVQSGTLGVSAMIILLFISISLLTSVENTLNDIWGVARGRTYLSRIIQYWAVITLGPIFLLAAITVSATPHMQLEHWLPGAAVLSGFISEFVPLIVFTIVFTLLYRLMPNTRVDWRAALVGGLVGGVLLYLNNKFSMLYFGQVVRNSKIYGSLGSIPVFLIGLYFSWIILLLGAQVAYAYQNRRAFFQERQAENIHERGREFVALRIMTLIAERFAKGERPPTVSQISEELSIPSRLISKVVEPLLLTRLLVEVKTEQECESAYDPGRPLEKISCQDILDSMRAGIGQDVPTKDDEMRKLVAEQFENIHKAEAEIGATITLRDLAQRKGA